MRTSVRKNFYKTQMEINDVEDLIELTHTDDCGVNEKKVVKSFYKSPAAL